MLQCKDCEFFSREADGKPHLSCDPYSTIKEPECLLKWQFHHLSLISQSHEATLAMYRRLAPLQEKMFEHMEREINEADDADRWKSGFDDDEEEDSLDDDDEHPFNL